MSRQKFHFPFKQVDTRLGLGKEKEVLDDGGAGNNKSVFSLSLFLTPLNFPEGEAFFQLLPPPVCQCCYIVGIATLLLVHNIHYIF